MKVKCGKNLKMPSNDEIEQALLNLVTKNLFYHLLNLV